MLFLLKETTSVSADSGKKNLHLAFASLLLAYFGVYSLRVASSSLNCSSSLFVDNLKLERSVSFVFKSGSVSHCDGFAHFDFLESYLTFS